MPETIKGYLAIVQEQIRWKRAQPVLLRELEQHLEDQRDDFLKEGKCPEEAERLAVQDMGDPVTVGTELDAVHRPRPQRGLLALTIALALVGAVLRVSFRPGGSVGAAYPLPATVLRNSLAALVLGTGAMLGMYFLDVSRLARHARAVYAIALAAGLLPLWIFPDVQNAAYYTRYEVLLYPVAYAFWFYSFRGKGWLGLFLTVLGGVPLAVVCVMAPFVTGLLLLLFSGLVLTLFAACQDWFGVGRRNGLCAVLGAAFSVLAYLAFHGYFTTLSRRLQIALHPELDPQGRGFAGWVLRQLLEGLLPVQNHPNASGAAFGLWGSPIQLGHDFLPAQMAVQWGWLPFLLLVAALMALLAWLLVKGLGQKYLLGRFVVLAVVLTLAGQLLFSVALNLGFVLFAAGLPLVVGNLQTVLDMALIGLALSVFRGASIGRDEPAGLPRARKRLRIRLEYQ